MRFITHFVAVSAILLASANAAPTSPSKRESIQPSSGCTTMPPGSCNLSLVGLKSITYTKNTPSRKRGDSGPDWKVADIYDHNCRKIGSLGDPSEGNAVTSELPYTVVLSHLQTWGDYNWIGMKYADYSFDGYFACGIQMASGDGIVGYYNMCQHAFPCPA